MTFHKTKCPECKEEAKMTDNNAVICDECGYIDITCPICENHVPVVKTSNGRYLCEDCEYVFKI